MNQETSEDTLIYKVVVNHEEQYSIWAVERENPPGWNDAGYHGSRAECLAYIETVWTDMRPLSIRNAMANATDQAQSDPSATSQKEKNV
jgi:MbtH protein